MTPAEHILDSLEEVLIALDDDPLRASAIDRLEGLQDEARQLAQDNPSEIDKIAPQITAMLREYSEVLVLHRAGIYLALNPLRDAKLVS